MFLNRILIFRWEIITCRMEIARRESFLKEAYEQHNDTQTKKRVELYEATFNAELEDYRRRRENEISSLYSRNCVFLITFV